eukprot:TRINITY_DN16401_c0_g1_i1.p1 TRINITY_DN16401_c0_g1~~TRINITY_DN16401_c0_g1_i1.p1  ORF type:complete len:1311 (-),score=236.74 TRINITY_DN16401_c0_g1_i1:72-4004(-)
MAKRKAAREDGPPATRRRFDFTTNRRSDAVNFEGEDTAPWRVAAAAAPSTGSGKPKPKPSSAPSRAPLRAPAAPSIAPPAPPSTPPPKQLLPTPKASIRKQGFPWRRREKSPSPQRDEYEEAHEEEDDFNNSGDIEEPVAGSGKKKRRRRRKGGGAVPEAHEEEFAADEPPRPPLPASLPERYPPPPPPAILAHRKRAKGPEPTTHKAYHGALVELIHQRCEGEEGFEARWASYCDEFARGAILSKMSAKKARDPASHPVAFLKAFLETESVSETDNVLVQLVNKVERLLEEDPRAGEIWSCYCDLNGGSVYEPCEHGETFLHTFLTELMEGTLDDLPVASRCVGEVRFDSPDHAAQAMQELSGTTLMDVEIQITLDEGWRIPNKLIIKNVHRKVSREDLKAHFAPIGRVAHAQVHRSLAAYREAQQSLRDKRPDKKHLDIVAPDEGVGSQPAEIRAYWKRDHPEEPKGPQFGEIRYELAEDALRAVQELEGSTFMGSELSVTLDAEDDRFLSRLLIENIPPKATYQKLREHFMNFGNVAFARIYASEDEYKEAQTRLAEGMKVGEVCFEAQGDALRALQMLEGRALLGVQLVLREDPSDDKQQWLLVENLVHQVTWQGLKAHFLDVGKVAYTRVGRSFEELAEVRKQFVVANRGTYSPGFGTTGEGGFGKVGEVCFEGAGAAARAADALAGSSLLGQEIQLRVDSSSDAQNWLFVENLPVNATYKHLREHFSEIGRVAYARVDFTFEKLAEARKQFAVGGHSQGKGYGKSASSTQFGEVRYESQELAKNCVELLQGSVFMNLPLKLTLDPCCSVGTRVIIENIHPDGVWQDVKEHFKPVGNIKFIWLHRTVEGLKESVKHGENFQKYFVEGRQTVFQTPHPNEPSKIYPSAFITDMPSTWTEADVIAMHKSCGLSGTDLPSNIKMLPSKFEKADTISCIARYQGLESIHHIIEALIGHAVILPSGRSRYIGAQLAKPARWMVEKGLAPESDGEERQKVSIWNLPAQTTPADVKKLHEFRGVDMVDYPVRIIMRDQANVDMPAEVWACYASRASADRVIEKLRGSFLPSPSGRPMQVQVRLVAAEAADDSAAASWNSGGSPNQLWGQLMKGFADTFGGANTVKAEWVDAPAEWNPIQFNNSVFEDVPFFESFCQTWELDMATSTWLSNLAPAVLQEVCMSFDDSLAQTPLYQQAKEFPIWIQPCNQVILERLPEWLGPNDLHKLLGQYGRIEKFKVDPGSFKALVQMHTAEEAGLVVEDLNFEKPFGHHSSYHLTVRYHAEQAWEIPQDKFMLGTVTAWNGLYGYCTACV